MDWADGCLLDNSYLEAVEPLVRRVCPRQVALLVDVDDPEDFRAAVDYACQLWGGAATFLIPMDRADGKIDPVHTAAVRGAGIDVFRRHLPEPADADIKTYEGWPRRIEPLLGAALHDLSGTNRPSVTVALPASSSPWRLVYLATLGSWPERPDALLLEEAGLVPDLAFGRLVELETCLVEEPSVSDLLTRLKEPEGYSPARASTWNLAPQPRRWLPRGPSDRRMPTANEDADRLGPNLLVVCEPDSVADACLLWNLRALHGLPQGLPLGAPITSSLAGDLASLVTRETAMSAFFGETRLGLTSQTVPEAAIDSLLAPGTRSWAPAWDLLAVARPSSRTSAEVGAFRHGRASVPLVAPADSEILRRRPRQYGLLDVTSSFNRVERPMPNIPGLRRQHSSGFGPLGFEFDLRQIDQIGAVEWPPGWVVLEAVVRDRGLRVRRSAPGIAAESLIRTLGGISALDYLAARPVIDRLHRLAERRAMSWFRQKLRDIAATSPAGDASLAERIEAGLSDLVLRPFDDEQHEAAYSDFLADFGGDRPAATRWVQWAERAGALVKGANFSCSACGAASWRSVDEFGPRMVCRGCGTTIGFPLGADHLPFKYRASEAVLRAVEFDALPHLLALRWLVAFYRPFPERTSHLYGVHPGVELLDQDGRVIAEIDVMLVLDDGSLIPGEVKRTGRGLKTGDIEKLDRAVQALGSPWSFLATIDWASDCDQIWRDAMRGEPVPRFSLNGEDLLAARIFPGMGIDVFSWAADTSEERVARFDRFKAYLADMESWKSALRIPGRITLPDQ